MSREGIDLAKPGGIEKMKQGFKKQITPTDSMKIIKPGDQGYTKSLVGF